jgi:hypothetical protein
MAWIQRDVIRHQLPPNGDHRQNRDGLRWGRAARRRGSLLGKPGPAHTGGLDSEAS